MPDLVRHDALYRKFLALRLGTLEHLHQGALRIFEGDHVGDGRLRVLQAPCLDAVRRGLLLERVEIVVRPDLETETHALRCAAVAQHDRVMVESRGEIGGILILGDEVQAEDIGVVLNLRVEIGRFISRVRDFLHADHLPGVFLDHHFGLCMEPMTSTMTAQSFSSARPRSLQR